MPSVTVSPELVRELFGDFIDAEAVAKMGPDPSGVHVNGLVAVRYKPRRARVHKMSDEGRKRLEQAGAGIGVVSSVIGAGEVAGGVKDTRRMVQAGAPTKKVALRGVRRIGGGTVLLAGDVLGTIALKDSAARRNAPIARSPRESVDKGLIPLGKLRKGRLSSVKRLFGFGPTTAKARPNLTGRVGTPTPSPTPPGTPLGTVPNHAKGPVTPGSYKAMKTGAGARERVENFVGSTSGKVALGMGAAYGIHRRGVGMGKEQAYYGKADTVDVGIQGTFSKFDDDKKRAYGWASVVTMDGEPVVDRQGDYIGLEDIEEAAYTYVRKSRVAGDMHRRTPGEDGTDSPHKAGELIESVVFTPDKCHAMGLPASFSGKWWMGVQVEDDEVWAEVKKGNRTGFSIHGKGIRKDTTLDDIKAGR